MTREQAVTFLLNRPKDFAHMVGLNKLGDLHNQWIVGMLRGKGDKTLQAHRISYKTTCAAVALALRIVLLPNQRTLFMRKTDNDVKEVINQVKKILLDQHTQYFIMTIYGIQLRMMKDSQLEIDTNLTTDVRGTSQLVGMGMGSSITGKHFEMIFTDDIVNVNDRISKAERERTKVVYQELQNLKMDGGRIFNTGTPWHEDDCFTIMPKAERYDCYTTGILSAEELEERKSKMLPSLFACNYELKIVASEDVIFRDPQTGANAGLAEQGIAHIDAAYGGSDYTAFTIANRRDGKIYVYGRCWQKHVEEVEDEIVRLAITFNVSKIWSERNADKGFLAKELKQRGVKAPTYHEKMNKHLKICSYLVSSWKNVVFVEGTDEEYIKQICDYYEDADHDDCPDSLASVVRIYTKKGNSDYEPIWMGG